MEEKIKNIEKEISLIKQSLEKIEKSMATEEDLGKLYGGMRGFFDERLIDLKSDLINLLDLD